MPNSVAGATAVVELLEGTPDFAAIATVDSSGHAQISPLARLQEIESLVDVLIASWHSSQAAVQCRRWHRVPCRRPLLIQPIDHETGELLGVPRRVEGRDVSVGGISFTHRHPLAFRHVAILFECEDGGYEAVVTRLTWCRFTRQGNYQSGGQFLRRMRFPAERPLNLDELLFA